MRIGRWSTVFLLSLAGCSPDKQTTLSDTLNPSTFTLPGSGGDNGNDEEGDASAGTSTGTSAGTSSPTSGVETLPPETSASTGETSATNPTQGTETTDPTNVTTVPGTDGSSSDPSNSDPSNSDPTNFLSEDMGVVGECDIWAENCPNGQKCMPYATNGSSWDAVKCVPVMGNDTPGQSCTVEDSGVSGLDSCVEHAICFGVDADTMTGTCVGMCTGSEDNPSCPGDLNCSISNMGVLILCLDGCDPLTDSCASDEVCVLNGGSFVCVIDASGTEGQQNDGCEFLNACDPGLACLDPSSVSTCQQNLIGCCTEWCDVNVAGTCAAGLDCIAAFEEGTAPVGYESIGFCGG